MAERVRDIQKEARDDGHRGRDTVTEAARRVREAVNAREGER